MKTSLKAAVRFVAVVFLAGRTQGVLSLPGRATGKDFGDEKQSKAAASLRLSESLRRESLTREEVNSSYTETASRGKFKVEAGLPLRSEEEVASWNKETAFAFTCGKLTIGFKLGETADWQSDKKEARYSLTLPTQDKQVKRVTGNVRLRWNRERLQVTLEGETPQNVSPFADKLTGAEPGKIEAEAPVEFRFGDSVWSFTATVRGNLKKRVAGNGSLYGSVVTLDLQGDGKAAK